MNFISIILRYNWFRKKATKCNNNKDYTACHYWYFNREFKFRKFVLNGCHDLLMSLILVILLLSLLKVLTIAVLFLKVANLMQLVY